MDPTHRRAFVVMAGSMVEQGILAVDLINEGVSGDSRRAWLGISALLGGAASVSKIVWPSSSLCRTEVRDHLRLTDDSVLRDRALRNHIEHLDERIDRWWTTSPNHIIVDTMIGPRSGVGVSHGGDMFRLYDPDTRLVYFNDESFDIQALVDELSRIAPYCSSPWFGEPPDWPGPDYTPH